MRDHNASAVGITYANYINKGEEMHEIIAKLHIAYTLIHRGMEEEDMLFSGRRVWVSSRG